MERLLNGSNPIRARKWGDYADDWIRDDVSDGTELMTDICSDSIHSLSRFDMGFLNIIFIFIFILFYFFFTLLFFLSFIELFTELLLFS